MGIRAENLALLAALYYLVYLLTFRCYGTHLPGDQRGWKDRTRGEDRGGWRDPSADLESHVREAMLGEPYVLNEARAQLVLESMQPVCAFRAWDLIAAHVRTTHVHCVVSGAMLPNHAVADLKAYSSRTLNRIEGHHQRWARGANARTLRTAEAIHAAIRYVADGQGEPMAVYVFNPTRQGGDSVDPSYTESPP